LPVIAEEAEHRGRAVELTEPAAESGVGDDASAALRRRAGSSGGMRRRISSTSSSISAAGRGAMLHAADRSQGLVGGAARGGLGIWAQ
jgi:hypothetical protein